MMVSSRRGGRQVRSNDENVGNANVGNQDTALATPLKDDVASIEDGMVVDLTGGGKGKSSAKRNSLLTSPERDTTGSRLRKKAKTLTGKGKERVSDKGLLHPQPVERSLDFPGNNGIRMTGLPGHVKTIELVDFMCHDHMTMDFAPHVTFISGKNGSGKSASLQALQCSLGVKATKHGKNASLSKLIRTGMDEAIVRVTIWNKPTDDYEAYRHDVYGDLITIERRITHRSHSWAIKGSDGKVVSRKKEELEHILHALNLNASNPVTVMTQNTARGLLGSTTSKADQEKYELYMDATQLGNIASNLAVTKACLMDMSENAEKIQDEYEKLEQTVSDAQARRDRLLRLEDLNQELQCLEIVFAMEIVLEQERLRDDVKERLSGNVAEESKKAEDALNEEHSRLERLQKKLEENCEMDNAYRAKATMYYNETDELKKRIKECMTQVNKFEKKLDRYKGVIEDQKAEIEGAKSALGALESDSPGANENNPMEDHLQNIRQATETKTKALERVNHLTSCIENAMRSTDEISEQISSGSVRLRSLESRIKSVEGQVQSLKRSSNDSMSEFGGPNIAKAIASIAEAYKNGKFSSEPIGPIGRFLGLKNPRYARAVEAAIGHHLNTFLVANKKDMYALRMIFQQVGIPNNQMPRITIINSKRNTMYSIPQSRIPKCTTVLSVLTCEQAVRAAVMNYLIDMGRIEAIALSLSTDDTSECSNLARSPLVNIVFDANGRRFTHRGNSLAFEGIDKRFRGRVPRLGVTKEDKINGLESDLKVLQEDLKKARSEVASLQKQDESTRKRMSEYEMKRKDAMISLEESRNTLSLLESTQTASGHMKDQDNPMDEIRAQIVEMETKILHAESQVEDAKSNLQEWEQKREEARKKLAGAQEEILAQKATIDAFMESFSALKDEIKATEKHISELKLHREKIGTKRGELQRVLEQAEANIEAYMQDTMDIVESRENAAEKRKELMFKYKSNGMTDEEIEKTFTRSMLEKKHQRVSSVIEQAHKEAGGSLSTVEKDLFDAKKRLTNDGLRMKNALNVFNYLKASYQKREKKLKEVDDYVERIVSAKFKHYMKKKGHFGKIRVNRKEKKLEISVRIGEKSQNRQGSGVIKDLKQLSGGERSFATVAFALALGGETDTPFRAMDEFDVFMDSVNRKIAMENLLSFARENPNLQFIFLTPQDMSVLYAAREQCIKQGLDIPDSFLRVVTMQPPRPAQGS